jgi:L-fucose isomerase-like protein
MSDRKPMDAQIAVKPVFVELVHSGPYEGPCRVGRKEDLHPETERQKGEEQFRNWARQIESALSDDARLLEPVKLQWKDDWHFPEEKMARLDQDATDTDLFLAAGGLAQYPAVAIARRFSKPLAMVGTVVTVDVAAFLRSRGLEGYAPLDFGELNRLISLLRVRKALSQTRILHALERDVIPVGVVSTIHDLEDLHDRFGVEHVTVPAAALLGRMDMLSPQVTAEAERLADDLIDGAERNHMRKDDVLPSATFYMAVKETMEELHCNAFTIPCFELCARQVAEQKRVTFCLTHSLLKDGGYPAACEGDVNVLMAMSLLMYLSRESSYMGNSSLVSKEDNTIRLGHDVPGMKMRGFDTQNLPYTIAPFTHAGWGATLRYDFSRDTGQPVTLARFDPAAKRLLIARGEITGGDGVSTLGCSLGVAIRVNDAVELFHQEAEFGHHLAMVYGDYVEDLRELSRLMGLGLAEV